jgi:fused signal recognition particle receptor
VLAVHEELGVPVKLVGTGEGPKDLQPFDARTFAEQLVRG